MTNIIRIDDECNFQDNGISL